MGTWHGLLTLACPATPKGSHRGSVKQDSRQGECPGEGLQVGERGRGTGRTVQKGEGGRGTCWAVKGVPGRPGFSSLPTPWVKGTLAGDHLRGVTEKVRLLGDPGKEKDRRSPPVPDRPPCA